MDREGFWVVVSVRLPQGKTHEYAVRIIVRCYTIRVFLTVDYLLQSNRVVINRSICDMI